MKVKRTGGFKKTAERVKQLTPQQVTAALYAAGQEIEIDAEHSITDGSISGAGHIPSLPGEPPNADTRLLDQSIETEIDPSAPAGKSRVLVSSNAPYGAWLEFGTSRMAPRPYMAPAAARKKAAASALVARAIKDVVNPYAGKMSPDVAAFVEWQKTQGK